MKVSVFCLALVCAGIAGPTLAADAEAGVPLSPAEAVGGWALSTNGREVCTIRLGARHTVRVDTPCSGLLSTQPTSWAPTANGMKLVAADGQTVLAFDRWSNSLFVSVVGSPADIQMRRKG